MKNLVYINGEMIERSQAQVDIENRAHQFGDGVYEVVAVWDGVPFKLDEHMQRLASSAARVDIGLPSVDWFRQEAREYLAGVECLGRDTGKSVTLYIQVTRGTCSRQHAYPRGLRPDIMMNVSPVEPHPQEYFSQGVKVITYPDRRWALCNVKSLQLMPNVMAKKAAKKSDAFEAIFIRNGFALEGSISNYFIVEGDELVTPPASNYILNGITRRTVIGLAAEKNIEVREESIEVERFRAAEEIFLAGTTTEIMPVVQIEGQKVGNGSPGETTLEIQDAYWQKSRP